MFWSNCYTERDVCTACPRDTRVFSIVTRLIMRSLGNSGEWHHCTCFACMGFFVCLVYLMSRCGFLAIIANINTSVENRLNEDCQRMFINLTRQSNFSWNFCTKLTSQVFKISKNNVASTGNRTHNTNHLWIRILTALPTQPPRHLLNRRLLNSTESYQVQ